VKRLLPYSVTTTHARLGEIRLRGGGEGTSAPAALCVLVPPVRLGVYTSK